MCGCFCSSQAFNWLLCNVIQTTSLHDILWHFVASLTPSPFEPEDEEEDENKGNKEIVEQVKLDDWGNVKLDLDLQSLTAPVHPPQERDLGVCEHPLSDIVIAGEAAHPLPHTFHRLLQTISDLMMSLPSGSSLQQMALRYTVFITCVHPRAGNKGQTGLKYSRRVQ